MSLWVLLMVPVAAFAAVAAMAGPQRLAAKFSTQEAADDLATFTVAWRDLHNEPTGHLPAMPMQCPDLTSAALDQKIEQLKASIEALIGTSQPPPNYDAQTDIYEEIYTELEDVGTEFERWSDPSDALLPDPLPPNPDPLPVDLDGWQHLVEELRELVNGWKACTLLYEALVGDLGSLGLDMNSLRGAYSDSLTQSQDQHQCSDKVSPDQAACEAVPGETWFPVPVPCWTEQQGIVVRDAVHVVLASRWQDAGWAAAQVWPDGLPMAAESVGRLSQRMSTDGLPHCDDYLAVLDEQGRPVWSTGPHGSRELVQSVPRTPLAG